MLSLPPVILWWSSGVCPLGVGGLGGASNRSDLNGGSSDSGITSGRNDREVRKTYTLKCS